MQVYNEKGMLETKIDFVHSGEIWRLKLLPNKLVASCSNDQTVKIWNCTNWSLVRTYKNHTAPTRGCCGLDNDTVASGSADQTIQIWAISSGKTLKTIHVGNEVNALLLLSYGLLASGNQNKHIQFWIFFELR